MIVALEMNINKKKTLNAWAFANERRFWHFFDIADDTGTRNGVTVEDHTNTTSQQQ